MKGRDFWTRLCRLIVLQILFSFSDMFSDLSTGRLWGNLPTNMYSKLIDQNQLVDCEGAPLTFIVFVIHQKLPKTVKCKKMKDVPLFVLSSA